VIGAILVLLLQLVGVAVLLCYSAVGAFWLLAQFMDWRGRHRK